MRISLDRASNLCIDHMTTFCSARMDVLWRASCLSKDLSTAAVANSKVPSLNLSKAQQSIEATRSPVWTCRQLRTLLFLPSSANMPDTHLLKYSQVSKCKMEMVICPDMPSFHLFLHLMYLMSTLCLYTDSALIHSVSFQLTFPIFSKWISSDFSMFSASKVRTGADRLWAPFQVISHDCSEFFVDFLHQFIDYIDFVWFSLYHLLSSCQVSEFPHLWLGCLWPAKVMPKKGCSSHNPKFGA